MVRTSNPAPPRIARPSAPRAGGQPPTSPDEQDAMAQASAHLAAGDMDRAAQALLPVLAARAAAGDHASSLAITLLDHKLPQLDGAAPGLRPVPDDQLCRTMDQLLRLVHQQDAQLRRLHAMLESLL